MERGGQLQFWCGWMGCGGLGCAGGVLSGCWDVPGGVVWMLTGGGSCEEGGSVAASVERALTHPVFPPTCERACFCFSSV